MRELERLELCFDCTIAEVGGEEGPTPQDEWWEWYWMKEPHGILVPSGDAAEFATMPCERCGDTLAGYRQQFVVLG